MTRILHIHEGVMTKGDYEKGFTVVYYNISTYNNFCFRSNRSYNFNLHKLIVMLYYIN